VACIVVLLGAASGLARLELANPLIRGLPDEAAPARAYAAASAGFPTAGFVLPTVAVLTAPDIEAENDGLRRLQELLSDQPGVASVFGPGTLPGAQSRGVAVSSSADAARFLIAFDSDPLGGRAVDVLGRLKRRAPELLRRAGLENATLAFAGDTALTATTVERALDDLKTVGPLSLLALFVVLALFLRSLVAPIYLVAASVLGVAAAFGLTGWLAGVLFDASAVSFLVPFAVAVLLIALGSDYNVFLVSEIWKEARRRPLREAVRVGSRRASGPINVAGFILAASFALLALVPLAAFRAIAFTMAAGLAIDVVLVRTLLVPALISLVGPRSGWPGRRLRP
jgi:RND superfamily putative drug exporter